MESTSLDIKLILEIKRQALLKEVEFIEKLLEVIEKNGEET